MTTNRALLTLILLVLSVSLVAQEKQLSLNDLMNRQLYPASLPNLQWRSNEAVTWNAGDKVVQHTLSANLTDTVLSLGRLNEALKAGGTEAIKGLPAYRWRNELTLIMELDGKLATFDMHSKQVSMLNTWDTEGGNADIEPATGRVAYTKANNLFVSSGGKTIPVTNDADINIVNGQSVHRNEFGISKGTFWSPAGNLLAFYRMDQTMVTDYPLVNIDERVGEAEMIKYPMAGMKSHQVTVGVFNPASGTVTFLKTGEPADQYLTNISWSPDEKLVFIAVLNRDQDHMWLNAYDAATGDFVRTLFEETDREYVEPLHGMTFLRTNPSQFIWQSRRDGWNHLYLYDISGKLIRQLTSGKWEVTELEGLDPKETKVFFTSTMQHPLERHFYSVDLKKGEIVQLTADSGTHSVTLSPDAMHFADRFSSLGVASRYTVNETSKKGSSRLIKEDINPLKDYKTGKTELLTLKSADGSDLCARMIRPADFNEAVKYPVLIYVYGGPHSQLVTDTWLGGSNLYFQYLASKGYIVFTLDNHGTSNRGADFEQAVHRRLGDLEVEDQMAGVRYLKSLPYVDSTRLAVDGWSYGGFMTLSMVLRNPGVFKVATCGGPVVDWKYYEVMYGERYMDTPEQNPDGYRKASLLNYADKLDTKLLMIHGAQDNTVVWQHSLKLLKEFIKSGKQVDYFVYPNHEHNVSGKDRIHLYRKLAEYYGQNL